ncbi:hypothetical protein RB653_000609 [Dictyostelium firmibasis]|uniref:Uncharacterized protein n=1 Tax=Dictyostelium firmibasis TaxID=79012 RepID=A0AAN7U659_9MYCE
MKLILILILIYYINSIDGSVIRLLTFNNEDCNGEPYNIVSKNICSSKGCFKVSPNKKIIYGMSLTSNERVVSGNNIGECIRFENSSSVIEYQESDNLFSYEGYCNEIIQDFTTYKNDDDYDNKNNNNINNNNQLDDCKTVSVDSLKGEYCGFNSTATQDSSNYYYYKKSCNLDQGVITLSKCQSCSNGEKNCKIIQIIQTKTQTKCTSISSKKYTYHNIFDNNSNQLNFFNYITLLLISLILILI